MNNLLQRLESLSTAFHLNHLKSVLAVKIDGEWRLLTTRGASASKLLDELTRDETPDPQGE